MSRCSCPRCWCSGSRRLAPRYELAALYPPFKGQSLVALAKAIDKGAYDPLPPHYSGGLSRLVRVLLDKDHARRPSVATILSWLAERPKGMTRQEINAHRRAGAAAAAGPAPVSGDAAVRDSEGKRAGGGGGGGGSGGGRRGNSKEDDADGSAGAAKDAPPGSPPSRSEQRGAASPVRSPPAECVVQRRAFSCAYRLGLALTPPCWLLPGNLLGDQFAFASAASSAPVTSPSSARGTTSNARTSGKSSSSTSPPTLIGMPWRTAAQHTLLHAATENTSVTRPSVHRDNHSLSTPSLPGPQAGQPLVVMLRQPHAPAIACRWVLALSATREPTAATATAMEPGGASVAPGLPVVAPGRAPASVLVVAGWLLVEVVAAPTAAAVRRPPCQKRRPCRRRSALASGSAWRTSCAAGACTRRGCTRPWPCSVPTTGRQSKAAPPAPAAQLTSRASTGRAAWRLRRHQPMGAVVPSRRGALPVRRGPAWTTTGCSFARWLARSTTSRRCCPGDPAPPAPLPVPDKPIPRPVVRSGQPHRRRASHRLGGGKGAMPVAAAAAAVAPTRANARRSTICGETEVVVRRRRRPLKSPARPRLVTSGWHCVGDSGGNATRGATAPGTPGRPCRRDASTAMTVTTAATTVGTAMAAGATRWTAVPIGGCGGHHQAVAVVVPRPARARVLRRTVATHIGAHMHQLRLLAAGGSTYWRARGKTARRRGGGLNTAKLALFCLADAKIFTHTPTRTHSRRIATCDAT